MVDRILPKKIQSERMTITPTIAMAWLESNHDRQRKVNKIRVENLAKIMADGRWGESNDDICFDVNNNLINGQHRLNAVIKSGATIESFVKFNMPSESMTYMDTNQARTNIQRLNMIGYDTTKAKTEVARFIAYLISRQTSQDIFNIMSCHDYYREEIDFLHDNSARKILAPIRSALVVGMNNGVIDGEMAINFIEAMEMPRNESEWAATSLNNKIKRIGRRYGGDRCFIYKMSTKSIVKFSRGEKSFRCSVDSPAAYEIKWNP
jgi:hypothetical protein